MKANLIAKFKNPLFLLQIGAAIAIPVLAYAGLTVQDMTSWKAVWDVILGAIKNPYVLGLAAISVFNAIQKP